MYFHRLGDLTDLEYDADGWVAVDLQDDAGLGKGTKPPQCCFEPVGTYREIRQNVGTRFVGDRASADPGIGLCRGDFNPNSADQRYGEGSERGRVAGCAQTGI